MTDYQMEKKRVRVTELKEAHATIRKLKREIRVLKLAVKFQERSEV